MMPHGAAHLSPPTPMGLFSWNTMWTACPPAACLEPLRRSVYSDLLARARAAATGDRPDTTPGQDADSAERLLQYADEVTTAVVAVDVAYRRRAPLVFHWHFPGEPGAGVASMRCALPAFEVMCASTTAVLLLYAAVRKETCPAARHALALRCDEVARRAGTWCTGAPGAPAIVSEVFVCHEDMRLTACAQAQWSRLRRQLLPMQLMPQFLEAVGPLALHSCTTARARCAVSRLPSWWRSAEDTAAALMNARRRALCSEQLVTGEQRGALQDDYDGAYECYWELVCTGATCDAECALDDVATHPYVNGLVLLARCAARRLTRRTPTPAMTARWSRVESINSGSTVPQVTDVDEVLRWRIECLPRLECC